MKMEKRILITLLVLSMFMFGCEKDISTTATITPFIGGTDGVILSFVENAPPAEVYDGGDYEFSVTTKLTNKGEFYVPKGKVFVEITGVQPQEFDRTTAQMSKSPDEDLIEVRKEDSTVLESPPVFVEFPGFNHKAFIQSAALTYPIRAKACYNYGTTSNALLCIRKNPLNPEEGGICEVNEDKTVYNSGAPVQVTSFKESARAKDKVGFVFTIEHKGTGKVFEIGNKCDETTTRFNDKVHVKIDSGMSGLVCSGLAGGDTEGDVILYGGSKPISCTQTIKDSGDYMVPATIEITYDYASIVETSLTVKHSGE
jgi:hypothetical protein